MSGVRETNSLLKRYKLAFIALALLGIVSTVYVTIDNDSLLNDEARTLSGKKSNNYERWYGKREQKRARAAAARARIAERKQARESKKLADGHAREKKRANGAIKREKRYKEFLTKKETKKQARAKKKQKNDTKIVTKTSSPISAKTSSPISTKTSSPISAKTSSPISPRTRPPISPRTRPPQSFDQVCIDLDIKNISHESTKDRLEFQFWKGTSLLPTIDIVNGVTGTSWCHDFPSTNGGADALQITTTGTDALMIDKIQLARFGDMKHGKSWGADNGKGWCLSNDPNDINGSWKEYAPACHRCIKFKYDGTASPCG